MNKLDQATNKIWKILDEDFLDMTMDERAWLAASVDLTPEEVCEMSERDLSDYLAILSM